MRSSRGPSGAPTKARKWWVEIQVRIVRTAISARMEPRNMRIRRRQRPGRSSDIRASCRARGPGAMRVSVGGQGDYTLPLFVAGEERRRAFGIVWGVGHLIARAGRAAVAAIGASGVAAGSVLAKTGGASAGAAAGSSLR